VPTGGPAVNTYYAIRAGRRVVESARPLNRTRVSSTPEEFRTRSASSSTGSEMSSSLGALAAFSAGTPAAHPSFGAVCVVIHLALRDRTPVSRRFGRLAARGRSAETGPHLVLSSLEVTPIFENRRSSTGC
jgi:hypothetical protein